MLTLNLGCDVPGLSSPPERGIRRCAQTFFSMVRSQILPGIVKDTSLQSAVVGGGGCVGGSTGGTGRGCVCTADGAEVVDVPAVAPTLVISAPRRHHVSRACKACTLAPHRPVDTHVSSKHYKLRYGGSGKAHRRSELAEPSLHSSPILPGAGTSFWSSQPPVAAACPCVPTGCPSIPPSSRSPPPRCRAPPCAPAEDLGTLRTVALGHRRLTDPIRDTYVVEPTI